MVFTTGGFLEVAIESWPELNLNPRPLNPVQNIYIPLHSCDYLKKISIKNKCDD